jgi:predicted Zn-dependent protease
MNRQLTAWLPGILAAITVVGMLTWFIVDSPDGSLHPAPRKAPPKAVSSPFETPAPVVGESAVAASKSEPLFEEAMTYYRAHDYSRASFTLRQATARQPGNPEIRFFLGISYLRTKDTRAGINELKVAEGLEASSYDDRIHFFLAKAFLQQNDTANAARCLNDIVEKGGTLAEPARKLKVEMAQDLGH